MITNWLGFQRRKLLDTTLKPSGLQQLQSDKCIYIIERSINTVTEQLILGVYVDDILRFGKTNAIKKWFREIIINYFSIAINLKFVHF